VGQREHVLNALGVGHIEVTEARVGLVMVDAHEHCSRVVVQDVIQILLVGVFSPWKLSSVKLLDFETHVRRHAKVDVAPVVSVRESEDLVFQEASSKDVGLHDLIAVALILSVDQVKVRPILVGDTIDSVLTDPHVPRVAKVSLQHRMEYLRPRPASVSCNVHRFWHI